MNLHFLDLTRHKQQILPHNRTFFKLSANRTFCSGVVHFRLYYYIHPVNIHVCIYYIYIYRLMILSPISQFALTLRCWYIYNH